MWLIFALIAPLFFAIVHVLDSHCVVEIFDRPWMGVITSAIASIVVFLILPFIAPFINWTWPGWQIIFLALFSGALIQLSQAFYFHSLNYSEAGIIAAYWNIIPALLPISSFLLWGSILNTQQYLGIIILIFCSIVPCVIDSKLKSKRISFLLMFIASVLQVVTYLIEDIVFQGTSFAIGFFLITTGLIISGILPLLFVRIRRVFQQNFVHLRPMIYMFLFIEMANLYALANAQLAIDLGDPSLVAAVETIMPAYTFILSLLLIKFLPRFSGLSVRRHLGLKFSIVFAMVFGVYLVH